MKFSEIKPDMIFFYAQMATAVAGRAWANVLFLGEKSHDSIDCITVRTEADTLPEIDEEPISAKRWDQNCREYFQPLAPHIRMIIKGVFGDFN
jgi:hypothetical protein